MDHIESFRRAIEAAGLVPPARIKDDGKRHRFSSSGQKGDDAGWYVLHGDDKPAGAFGCWRTGANVRWSFEVREALTAEERAAWRRRMASLDVQRQIERERSRASAAEKAARLWELGKDATKRAHPYLRRKRIPGIGARVLGDMLLVPMFDGPGCMVGLQVIQPSGERKFLKGTPGEGAYLVLGQLRRGKPAVLCEGYATGVSILMATRWPVIVAFSASNLRTVASKLQHLRADVCICVGSDDDAFTTRPKGHPEAGKPWNPGLEAAKSCGFPYIQPIWMGPRGSGTDFNDLHVAEGLDAVAACFKQHAELLNNPQQPSIVDPVNHS